MADRPKGPTGAWLTEQLRRAEQHAENVAPLLEAAVAEVLAEAGELAARGFTARATSLTASAPAPSSTMICVKPTPEQAAALALEGGEPAEILHVTLCYLGDTAGPLSALVDALRPVALAHASLTGVVGGIGSFLDMGDGYPILALPDVPGLVELRVAVTAALTAAGVGYARDHGYCPHMTLAYRDAPAFAVEAAGVPLTFAELLIVRGDTEIIPLPLAGAPPVTAAAGPRVLPVPLPEGGRPVPPGWLEEAAGLEFRLIRDSSFAKRKSMFDEIRDAAEAHRPDGGYGETWWRDGVPDGSGGTKYNAGGTVFWAAADWSTNEEVDAAEAAFLAIDGVGHFDYEAEAQPTPWRLVWGGSMVAASPPLHQRFAGDPNPWIAPGVDEILDVAALIARITARTKPVRDAAVAAAATPILNSVGINYDLTNPLVGEVLAQSGSQIVDIAHTTQLNVMRIVRSSYQAGLSIPHTAQAIREGMSEASVPRSRLIARTELAGAVNGGSLAAVRVVEAATGIAYHKAWMTAPGAKNPRHYLYDGLNGQSRRLHEEFSVGGAALQHPGDPEGPAGEVCNCRCAMRYGEGPPPALL